MILEVIASLFFLCACVCVRVCVVSEADSLMFGGF
jgi:hypothetical protein